MIVVTTPLSAAAFLSLLFLSLLFANLSRRLGAVTKIADHQRWFAVAHVCIGIAAVSQLIRGCASLAPHLALPFLLRPWFAVASFHVPLVIGVTVCLGLVWYYWGWIVRERIK
jgi:hypothetical protein